MNHLGGKEIRESQALKSLCSRSLHSIIIVCWIIGIEGRAREKLVRFVYFRYPVGSLLVSAF